jgi:tetratricopeptide (TPR) repeat protein
MTLDEALGELGVERGASPDEVRRAYLRLVKTRKPEEDPVGFRRLREAFERALRPAADLSVDSAWESREPAEITGSAESSGAETTLSEESEAAEEAGEEPLSLIARAEALVESDETAEATDCVLQALETGELTQETARRIMDVLFHLQAAEALVESLRIHHRLREILDGSGQETALIDGPAAAVWSLLCELLDLPPDFPLEIRTAFARAGAAGDLDQALPALWRFAGTNPEAARAAGAQLECLPLLAAAYLSTYARVRPKPEEGARRPRRAPARISLKHFLLALALFLAAVAISQCLTPLAR